MNTQIATVPHSERPFRNCPRNESAATAATGRAWTFIPRNQTAILSPKTGKKNEEWLAEVCDSVDFPFLNGTNRVLPAVVRSYANILSLRFGTIGLRC
jgi:hypothetical protein